MVEDFSSSISAPKRQYENKKLIFDFKQ